MEAGLQTTVTENEDWKIPQTWANKLISDSKTCCFGALILVQ